MRNIYLTKYLAILQDGLLPLFTDIYFSFKKQQHFLHREWKLTLYSKIDLIMIAPNKEVLGVSHA